MDLDLDLQFPASAQSPDDCNSFWGVFFQNGGNLPVSDKVTSKKHWHPSVFCQKMSVISEKLSVFFQNISDFYISLAKILVST